MADKRPTYPWTPETNEKGPNLGQRSSRRGGPGPSPAGSYSGRLPQTQLKLVEKLSPKDQEGFTDGEGANNNYKQWLMQSQAIAMLPKPQLSPSAKTTRIDVTESVVTYYNQYFNKFPDQQLNLLKLTVIKGFYHMTFQVPKTVRKNEDLYIYLPGTGTALGYSSDATDDGFHKFVEVTFTLPSGKQPGANFFQDIPRRAVVGSPTYYQIYSKILVREEDAKNKKSPEALYLSEMLIIMREGLKLAGWTRKGSSLENPHMSLTAPAVARRTAKGMRMSAPTKERAAWVREKYKQYNPYKIATVLYTRGSFALANLDLYDKTKIFEEQAKGEKPGSAEYKRVAEILRNAEHPPFSSADIEKLTKEIIDSINKGKVPKMNLSLARGNETGRYNSRGVPIYKYDNLLPAHALRSPHNLSVVQKDIQNKKDEALKAGECYGDVGGKSAIGPNIKKSVRKVRTEAGEKYYAQCNVLPADKWFHGAKTLEMLNNLTDMSTQQHNKDGSDRKQTYKDKLTSTLNTQKGEFAAEANRTIMVDELPATSNRVQRRYGIKVAQTKEEKLEKDANKLSRKEQIHKRNRKLTGAVGGRQMPGFPLSKESSEVNFETLHESTSSDNSGVPEYTPSDSDSEGEGDEDENFPITE